MKRSAGRAWARSARMSLGFTGLLACTDAAAPVIQPRTETPTAIAPIAQQAASTQVTAPTVNPEVAEGPLCDREWAAGKGPKLKWPGQGPVPNQPVWVNFWAGWCKPCMEELPHMIRAAEAGGFTLLAISLDDDDREYRRALDKLKVGSHVRTIRLGDGQRAAWFKASRLEEPSQLPAHLAVDARLGHRCWRRGAVEGSVLDNFRDYVTAVR